MGLFSRRDYVSEWNNLNYEEKEKIVLVTMEGYLTGRLMAKYPPKDLKSIVSSIIEECKEQGHIKDMIVTITEGYSETGLNKPHSKVVKTFVSNYFKSIERMS
jgi:hypothetical protein